MEKSDDQIAREKIPTRDSLPTQYHPMHNLLMCIPLPTIKSVGNIILPDRAQITLNEGHVVEKGPLCSEHIGVGDCVTWDAQSEYRLDVDGVKFILVKENSITMKIPRSELSSRITLDEAYRDSIKDIDAGLDPGASE